MVRQAYINRLILGRSAFEPPTWQDRQRPPAEVASGPSQQPAQASASDEGYEQRYDDRGHPENRGSRTLARRSRRAQNDVLSTIGVCVCVDENGNIKSNFNPTSSKARAEKELAQATIQENADGFHAGIVDALMCELATEWAINLRRRIQTFAYYSGISMVSIVEIERYRLGTFAFFMAGELSAWLSHVLEIAVEGAFSEINNLLIRNFTASHHTGKVYAFVEILSALVFYAISAPLQLIYSLQRLGLIDCWPPLPSINRYTLTNLLLPPRPAIWTRSSALAYAGSLALSPVPAWLCLRFVSRFIENSLTQYFEAAVLRPDNPDSESYKLKMLDGSPIEAPVLSLPTFQSSLLEEISKDINYVAEEVTNASDSVKTFLRRGIRSARRFFLRAGEEGNVQTVTFARGSAEDQLNEPSHTGTHDPSSLGSQDPSIAAVSNPTTSLPTSPVDSNDPEQSDVEPSTVQVRTRSGSTSTLHMDLEVNVPVSRRNAPVFTSSFAATPRPTAVQGTLVASSASSKPHHRVTALTLHPSSTLSTHLARVLTSAICIPLESIYLRSLAGAFLASKGAESAWLANSVYSPYGLGLGFRGWSGFGGYAVQLMLCFGMEMVCGFGAWRICCAWPLWAGRKWYSWGKL